LLADAILDFSFSYNARDATNGASPDRAAGLWKNGPEFSCGRDSIQEIAGFGSAAWNSASSFAKVA